MVDRPTRKLAVILHSDVVDSTALVQRHEMLAHTRIQDSFHRFSRIIEAYGGAPRELRGDALVAEFNRVSDAVTAAIAFQRENAQFLETLEDDVRPMLRVGIAMGEVVVADGTVTGDGVVLAQRLEQLAGPGEICLQGAAYETVPKRFPFEYESKGEQSLKGFAEPVRAYGVRLEGGESLPAPESGSLPAKATPERAERPSIAVLPFTNVGSDAELEFFCDGLTNDIITDLSKFGRFSVVPAHSIFTYKGESAQVQQIAEELAVRYVLEGSIQKAGQRVRINAQLVDASTGQHIWTERYTREADDPFAIQDEMIETIVATLTHKIDAVEAERRCRASTEKANAHDLYLRGRELFFARTKESNRAARELMEHLIGLDPSYSRAYGFLAWLYVHDYRYGWSNDPEESLDLALAMARKALELDSSDYESHWRLGIVYLYRRQFDKAMNEYERARSLNPNHAGFLAEMSGALLFMGRIDEAIDQLKRAMRINPYYPEWFLVNLGWAYYEAGRYEDALATLSQLNNPPAVLLPIVAATYVRLGLDEEARATTTALLEGEPQFTLSTLLFLPYKDETRRDRLAEDLQAAGVPP